MADAISISTQGSDIAAPFPCLHDSRAVAVRWMATVKAICGAHPVVPGRRGHRSGGQGGC
eukprot:scaffold7954_cov97-Isochrysis_galbana.AAC.4